jgi:hypothetical protein
LGPRIFNLLSSILVRFDFLEYCFRPVYALLNVSHYFFNIGDLLFQSAESTNSAGKGREKSTEIRDQMHLLYRLTKTVLSEAAL